MDVLWEWSWGDTPWSRQAARASTFREVQRTCQRSTMPLLRPSAARLGCIGLALPHDHLLS
eukprot:scaffold53217_cov52-Attheya_sp.AAC.2